MRPDLVAAQPGQAPPDPRGRIARLAVTVVFFINGLLFASWTAHIPHVKDHLALTDGTLGIALLGAPAGSVLAMLATMRLLPRLGSRRMVQITLAGYCAAGPVVGLTGSLAALFGALMTWGAFQGTLDVSMNTQAVAVERRVRRALMPGFHAAWSIGSFAGAAAGAAGVAIGLSLSRQLSLLAIPCLLAGGWLATRMIPDQPPVSVQPPAGAQTPANPQATAEARSDRTRRARARPGRSGPARDPSGGLRPGVTAAIAVLGLIAVADMLCEGAAADWAAVYLRTSAHAAAAIAGLGYASYSLAMVGVRLAGNRLLARFATNRVLPFLACVATAALTVGLVVNQVPAILIGFAGLGAGLAAVIPAAFSAAGRVPGIDAGIAIALVSSCGWAGFVCGPVLIGQLADATSLRLALVLLPLLTAVIAVATAASRTLRSAGPVNEPAGG